MHLAEKIAEYLRAAGLDVRIAEPVAFALVRLVESAATRWLDSPGGVSLEELSTDLTGWAWAVVDQATRSAGLTLDPHAIMPRAAELMAYPPPRAPEQPSGPCGRCRRGTGAGRARGRLDATRLERSLDLLHLRRARATLARTRTCSAAGARLTGRARRARGA